jgi:regulatory protein
MDARPRPSPAERRARRAAVDDPEEVLAAALRRLEVRAFSVDGLRRRLVEAGYQAGLVEGTLGRLAELGLLDDAAFARAWIESRDRSRPRGEHALRTELRRKGIADDDIAAALEDRAAGMRGLDEDGRAGAVVSSADEAAATRLLARRRTVLLREADPRQRRARAYALLARNGFDPDVCAAAVAAWLATAEPDPLPR